MLPPILRRSLVVAAAVAGVIAPPASAATTRYLSPGGSDAASGTRKAPCRTFARAYRAAHPGSAVILRGGDYGGQTLSNLPPKPGAAKIVFRPARGGNVRLGPLRIDNTQNVEVRDIRATGWGVSNGAAHVVLRNIAVTDVSGAAGYFSGAHDVRVIGGEIARVDPQDAIHMNAHHGHNTNIVIDGLFVHDLTRFRNPSSHNDCLQAGDVANLRIVNSRFVNCGTQGVFLNPYGGGTTRDITIENSWFGPAQLGYNALYVGGAVNVLVRNNSFAHGAHIDSPGSRTSMIGNIFQGMSGYTCSLNARNSVEFAYNLTAERCRGASHHRVARRLASDFVNPSAANAATFNLNLRRGAAAIDAGDPARSPATDYHGRARPAKRRPDIGAVEYGAGGRRRKPRGKRRASAAARIRSSHANRTRR